MKSKFLRVISIILVLSSLLSMFAVFAAAETSAPGETDGDGEDEEEALVEVMYNRTFSEGWSIKNGMNLYERGSKFFIDHEVSSDYSYNSFWRLEVGSKENGYAELTLDNYRKVGLIVEMDIKTDDITQIRNVLSFGTNGASSAQRTDYSFISIEDNQVYFMKNCPDFTDFQKSDDPAFTLGNEWVSLRFVFDYTYEKEPILETDSESEIERKSEVNSKWFALSIYYKRPFDDDYVLWNDTAMILYGQNGRGAMMMRYGTSGEKEEDFGTSLCFDNIRVYGGSVTPIDISDVNTYGYGSKVDPSAPKDVEIPGDASGQLDAFNNVLAMKIGVDNCSFKSVKRPIAVDDDGNTYGAPFKKDGVVYVPLDLILEYIGYPYYLHPDGQYIDISTGESATYIVVGKNTATVNSQTVVLTAAPAYMTDEEGHEMLVIASHDIDVLFPGFYQEYDDMGLITVSSFDNVIDRNANLSSMVQLMKGFIYTNEDIATIYEDAYEHTNGYQHPYLFMTPDDAVTLYEEYQALNEIFGVLELYPCPLTDEEIAELESRSDYMLWVHYQRLVNQAQSNYKSFAREENGEFKRLISDEEAEAEGKRDSDYSLGQPNLSNNGYDVGGRSFVVNRTNILRILAIGFMLTKNYNYLKAAYEIAIVIGDEWTHWGPGHFLNCADGSAEYALFFDWAYNGYVELNAQSAYRPNGETYEVDKLAEILARQGVHEGYISCNQWPTEHLSTPVGAGGALYNDRDNNWNAVCTSGMVMASLAILGENIGTYKDEAIFVIDKSIAGLINKGLDIYAPDGAYIESPNYWDYGTNNFFELCAVLDSTVGHDYNLMETWGMDQTCYFACHAESNDNEMFNYHDSNRGSINTGLFFYVAEALGDTTLYSVRYTQIEGNSKWAGIYDLIYYPRDIDLSAAEVKLDYYSDNIDLFATRASWESGALYASMIGGTNTLSHGQIDAGTFVYHNGGNVWICDMGTEDYNCEGFWPAATRYRFYRMKPEGNNTIALSSDPQDIPYGQLLDSAADATKWDSNEHGAYVVYDMTDTIRGRAALWERGMLVTNDRKTTVIQDQIAFTSMQTVHWFAHYELYRNVDKLEISSDGRTAYMYQLIGEDEYGIEQYQVLRLSIVSARKDYKFVDMDTYTFVHNDKEYGTYKKGFIATQGNGVPEKSRDQYRKLSITADSTIDFNLAVVIEMVDPSTVGRKDEIELGYEYVNMNEWEPTEDMRGRDVDEDTVLERGIPNINTHILQGLANLENYVRLGKAYTSALGTYYRFLTDAHYAIRVIGRDMPAEFTSQVNRIKELRAEYGRFVEELSRMQQVQSDMCYKLMGIA